MQPVLIEAWFKCELVDQIMINNDSPSNIVVSQNKRYIGITKAAHFENREGGRKSIRLTVSTSNFFAIKSSSSSHGL